MAAPVIYPAASEHRKATVAPTSSGLPSRASGTSAARSARRSSGRASSMAVAMGPGATRLQVTLREASSRATDRVSPRRPALAAAVAPPPPVPGAGQRQGAGPADAPGPAGDQRHAALAGAHAPPTGRPHRRTALDQVIPAPNPQERTMSPSDSRPSSAASARA